MTPSARKELEKLRRYVEQTVRNTPATWWQARYTLGLVSNNIARRLKAAKRSKK